MSAKPNCSTTSYNEHTLYIANGDCITIGLDKKNRGFPPSQQQLDGFNRMIHDLAEAIRCVVYTVENDPATDAQFHTETFRTLADSILLLTTLSSAVREELYGKDLEAV